MTAVDFLAQVAVTGAVVGLRIGSSAREVRDTLGDQCVEDRRRKSLRLDYGLLELSFFAGFCEGIAIQVHRLTNHQSETVVPEPLKHLLPELGRTISFELFRGVVERDGIHSLKELERQLGYRTYRITASHSTIVVVDEPVGSDDLIQVGDLWSIMISGDG